MQPDCSASEVKFFGHCHKVSQVSKLHCASVLSLECPYFCRQGRESGREGISPPVTDPIHSIKTREISDKHRCASVLGGFRFSLVSSVTVPSALILGELEKQWSFDICAISSLSRRSCTSAGPLYV